MQIIGIQSPTIQIGENVFEIFSQCVSEVRERDIVCIASKVVAYEQGRIRDLSEKSLSEIVREEADEVLSDGEWMLTVKDGHLICNAGIDESNVEKGSVVLWPEKIWEWAEQFRKQLMEKYDLKEVGVVVTDSRCTPRRLGVTGFALAWSGFDGIQDERGKQDLFGNEMQVTQRNIADSIADTATLIMGESAESKPFAVVHGAPVVFSDEKVDSESVLISEEEDLFG